jgi:hypothetical protein
LIIISASSVNCKLCFAILFLCIGEPSSVNSASITQKISNAIKSDDPTWEHCFVPDMSKKQAIQCKYCDKVIHGGITRVKYHLANIGGFNVTKCKKVPAHVKQEMEAFLTKKTGEKEQRKKKKQRDRDEIDLDKSDGSNEEDNGHENDVIVLKSTRESNNCSSSRPPTNGGSGTIDNFYKPQSVEESVHKNKIQTKLSTQKREDRRDRACEYICQFFL